MCEVCSAVQWKVPQKAWVSVTKACQMRGLRECPWIHLATTHIKQPLYHAKAWGLHKKWDFPALQKEPVGFSSGGNWDFQRLDWAAGLKVSTAANNLSFWQMRLDGCHLSPADHAGRDMCNPREMRSLLAFHRPAAAFAPIALGLSTFTHLSNAPDWAWTHTLLSAPLRTT